MRNGPYVSKNISLSYFAQLVFGPAHSESLTSSRLAIKLKTTIKFGNYLTTYLRVKVIDYYHLTGRHLTVQIYLLIENESNNTILGSIFIAEIRS